MFECQVVADSAFAYSRLTTMVVTYPRIIHSEMLRHRQLSRNAASSRAIPARVSIRQAKDEPFIPMHWGRAQAGMQAFAEIDQKEEATRLWLAARDAAVEVGEALLALNLHKQVPNRLLEPFLWITEVISATSWSNFFALRCHEMAEPHIQKIAYMMRDALDASTPALLDAGQWHTPLVAADEYDDEEVRKKVSVVRCARVSYGRHMEKKTLEEDLKRFEDLHTQGHWSPFEHVAQAVHWANKPSNFSDNWEQLRKTFPNECR